MNELIEMEGLFMPEEFMRLVNEKLAKLDPKVKPINKADAYFYHYSMGLSVETTVEEHFYCEQHHG